MHTASRAQADSPLMFFSCLDVHPLVVFLAPSSKPPGMKVSRSALKVYVVFSTGLLGGAALGPWNCGLFLPRRGAGTGAVVLMVLSL